MSRKLRIQYEGAVYHVMNRGDRREPIFKDDGAREDFLETLGQCCARTGWQVQPCSGRTAARALARLAGLWSYRSGGPIGDELLSALQAYQCSFDGFGKG